MHQFFIGGNRRAPKQIVHFHWTQLPNRRRAVIQFRQRWNCENTHAMRGGFLNKFQATRAACGWKRQEQRLDVMLGENLLKILAGIHGHVANFSSMQFFIIINESNHGLLAAMNERGVQANSSRAGAKDGYGILLEIFGSPQ